MSSMPAVQRTDPASQSISPKVPMISVALGCPRRRVVCAVLRDRNEKSLLIEELAAETAARQYDVDRSALSAADVRAVRTALHHVHLPQLTSIGAVTVDDDGERVRMHKSHGLFTDDTVGALLDDPELIRQPELDETVSILADRRKRALLAEIAAVDVALTRQSLAVRIASRETARDDTQTSSPAEVYHSLHHVHLPHFESLGLLEDVREQGTVRVSEAMPEVGLGDDDLVDVVEQVTAAIAAAGPADDE